MGTLISKPRNSENPPKKIRTRTYSGSSLSKKPNLFKSLSKRKDETARKSATLQPTRTGDNHRVASDTATEPILPALAQSEVKSSPVHLNSSHPETAVVNENAVQGTMTLVEEAIPKTADLVSKEDEVKVVEESKEQIAEESLQVHSDTPAEAVKVDEHSEICGEKAIVEETAEIARKVTDEVLEGCVGEEDSGENVEAPPQVAEEIQEPQQTIDKVGGENEESLPVMDEPQCSKEPIATEQESMDEIVRDHQEAEIAEILVTEALNAGVEAHAVEMESEAPIEVEKVDEIPDQPSEGVEPEEQRPQSSEQTSDYVEPMQQSQSVSEVFADPNEVSDGTKNIEAACLNDDAKVFDLKEVEQESESITEEVPNESYVIDNNVTNGHDNVSHGDNDLTEENGHLEEDGHVSDPIVTLKASDGGNLEYNEPAVIQE